MGIDTATPQSITAFDAALKYYYLGPIRDVLNSKTILLRRISRNEEAISGKSCVIPLNISRNEAVGFVAENANIPDAQFQGYVDTLVPMRWGYGRILFTGNVVAASRNDRGAFVRAVDGEVMGLIRDMKHETNRMMFGDGSGRLCTITNVAGAVYTVNNPGGFANVGPGTQYVRPNMVLGCIRAGVLLGSARVQSVNTTANTITLANAIAAPALPGDYFVRCSVDGAGAVPSGIDVASTGYNKEPMGLAGIVSDADPFPGALQGMAVATYPVWTSTVLGNAGIPFPLNLDIMQAAQDGCDTRGDGVPTLIVGGHNQRRAYLSNLVPDKQFVNTLELDGGFRVLEFNMIPFVVDKDATRGRLYFLDEEVFSIYRMSDYFWVDDDGSILYRLPNKHAFQATLAVFMELGCTARNRSAVITDLSEP